MKDKAEKWASKKQHKHPAQNVWSTLGKDQRVFLPCTCCPGGEEQLNPKYKSSYSPMETTRPSIAAPLHYPQTLTKQKTLQPTLQGQQEAQDVPRGMKLKPSPQAWDQHLLYRKGSTFITSPQYSEMNSFFWTGSLMKIPQPATSEGASNKC